MKFIELFAGIGGMGHGLMKSGMHCLGFVEINKFAHKAFKILHDPEERMWSRYDITRVSDDDIRLLGSHNRIDLISGGFPCQAFSSAGKREGFADRTRGTLFFQIVRFASILKPQYLLLENVKGLLNHDRGRTFATIICALDELGYDAEWQLLNSKDFGGVPQNRERIFIIGHLRGESSGEIFPIRGEEFGDFEKFRIAEAKKSVAAILRPVRTEYGKKIRKKYEAGEISESRHNMRTLQPRWDGTSNTLTSVQKDNYLFDARQSRIRTLTPLECFRLQSYPDEWYYTLKENGISDSQIYKMAGNGVTLKVASVIGKRIMAMNIR